MSLDSKIYVPIEIKEDPTNQENIIINFNLNEAIIK